MDRDFSAKIRITKTDGHYTPYSVGDVFRTVDVNVAEKIENKTLLFVQDKIGRIFQVPYGCYEICSGN